jgi:aspartyl-tRNA(Asn)/glutamyl-tRNA(Gln) amidotransferase subunit A
MERPSMSIVGSSAIEVAELVRSRRVRAVEIVRTTLARIERLDPALRSFVAIDAEGALAAAERVDRHIREGQDPGTLAGVPIGIKDNEPVTGLPTRFGSLLHAEAKPDLEDSEHVARLRAAGAIPIGKVAMGEFGLDAITDTLLHGTTRNPWNLACTPGGSSGGSAAAVSAGLVPLCTGSDALGSIRVPAAFTGLVGLKPSQGRVPRMHGFRDTAALGPLATTVADAARYLDAVSGPSARDRMTLPKPTISYERAITTLPVTGLRAAWSADLGFAPVEPEILAICESAFRRLCDVAQLESSWGPYSFINVYPEWNALAALELKADFERAGFLPGQLQRISPVPRALIESIRELVPAEQSEYRMRIRELERQVAEFFRSADLLVSPVAACAAYGAQGPLPTRIAGRDARLTNAEPFTAIGSICWLPSLSIPAGMTAAGLPVGLLITGPQHADEIVLRIGHLWERSVTWPRIAPAFMEC